MCSAESLGGGPIWANAAEAVRARISSDERIAFFILWFSFSVVIKTKFVCAPVKSWAKPATSTGAGNCDRRKSGKNRTVFRVLDINLHGLPMGLDHSQ